MRLIKKLDIFMARQFLLMFAGTFFISLFVLMMQFLWRYVDDLIGKGLSMEVLAEFFWYMALMLVPQALPLAVLLSSLITMGNLGESSELTAIKAAGVSLLRSLRGLMILSVIITGISFVFQNNIGPDANKQLRQLLLSMRHKSPELEIPEEVFYSGIPNCNLYVQKKDMETGMLYGVMIYRMTQSYEDAVIILADSGRLQSTADKQHLQLTLYSGEWFENMKSSEMSVQANVPYRRETFSTKVILMDFDNGFSMTDAAGISQMASAQSLPQLVMRVDSVREVRDSLGREVARTMRVMAFRTPHMEKKDSVAAVAMGYQGKLNADTLFNRLTPQRQRDMLQRASSSVKMLMYDLEMKGNVAGNVSKQGREYRIEMINKFTLSLTCIIFFFIGASLGAIIKKGGLGVPIIISVLVFILFYILDNTGYRMSRQGSWPIWFGKGLAMAVLIPLTTFITVKANKDSVVFNIDAYRNFFISLLGLRHKRATVWKEVIINDPDYERDVRVMQDMNTMLERYNEEHRLYRLPNPVKVFFKYTDDHEIEEMADRLEDVLEDLSNARDKYVQSYIAQYPIVSKKAHTRPFGRRWMNIAAAIIVPVGLLLYIRMWHFRLRLYKDIHNIRRLNELMMKRINDKMLRNIEK